MFHKKSGKLLAVLLSAMMLVPLAGNPVCAYAEEQDTETVESPEAVNEDLDGENEETTELVSTDESQEEDAESEEIDLPEETDAPDIEEAAEDSQQEETQQEESQQEEIQQEEAEDQEITEEEILPEEEQEISEETTFLGASSTQTADISVQGFNTNKGRATVCVENIVSQAGVKKVEAAIWSTAKQGDLKWYTAEKHTDGKYYITMCISDFQYNWAEYQCHIYVTDKKGNRTFAGSKVIDFTVKSEGFQVKVSKDQSKFTASISLPKTPAGFKDLKAAVWSVKNGQDDLIWYDMTYNQTTGNYRVAVPFSKLQNLGKYKVHIYAESKAGNSYYLAGKTCNVKCSCKSSSTEQPMCMILILSTIPI